MRLLRFALLDLLRFYRDGDADGLAGLETRSDARGKRDSAVAKNSGADLVITFPQTDLFKITRTANSHFSPKNVRIVFSAASP